MRTVNCCALPGAFSDWILEAGEIARRRCQWTYIPRALCEAAGVDSVG